MGRVTPGWVVLSALRTPAEQAQENELVSLYLHGPCFPSCPAWVLLLASFSDGALPGRVKMNKSFPSHCFWSCFFMTAIGILRHNPSKTHVWRLGLHPLMTLSGRELRHWGQAPSVCGVFVLTLSVFCSGEMGGELCYICHHELLPLGPKALGQPRAQPQDRDRMKLSSLC